MVKVLVKSPNISGPLKTFCNRAKHYGQTFFHNVTEVVIRDLIQRTTLIANRNSI